MSSLSMDETKKLVSFSDDSLHVESKGASLFSSTVNLTNTIVGAGVLTIPHAFLDTGAALGIMLLLFVCFFSSFGMYFLTVCCEITGAFSYKAIGKKSMGNAMGYVVEFVVGVTTIGSCTMFCVLMGDFVPSITNQLLSSSVPAFLLDRTSLLILIMCIVLLPLALLPKLDKLRFTSAIAMLFFLYLVSVAVFRYLTNSYEQPTNTTFRWFNISTDIFLSIPLISVAFTAHYNVCNLYKELKQRTPQRFVLCILGAACFCLVFYSLLGLAGYGSFRAETKGNIVQNYAADDVLIIIARIGVSFTLAFSFPLAFFACRSAFENFFLNNPKPLWRRQCLFVFILVPAIVTVSILEKRVENVVRLSGSTTGMFVTFILPALFFLRLSGKLEADWRRTLKRGFACTNVVLGMIFLYFGTTNSWKQFYQ
ncbi:hypothetical protein P9112_000783 [Eukaryota sp. TZLM1-RC]